MWKKTNAQKRPTTKSCKASEGRRWCLGLTQKRKPVKGGGKQENEQGGFWQPFTTPWRRQEQSCSLLQPVPCATLSSCFIFINSSQLLSCHECKLLRFNFHPSLLPAPGKVSQTCSYKFLNQSWLSCSAWKKIMNLRAYTLCQSFQQG